MPLRTGSDDVTISTNIRRLITEGYEQERAIDIALKKADTPNWAEFAQECRDEIGDAAPFQAADNDDGTVEVRNVHIFTCNKDFDKTWWDKAIETHSRHEADGLVMPGVHIGHPLRDEKGAAREERPNKGFLARLRRRGEQIYGDITSLARDVYEQVKKRELPGRSVELYRSLGRVGGLALLGSSMPKIPLTAHSADDMETVYFTNDWPPKKDGDNMEEDEPKKKKPGQEDEEGGPPNEGDEAKEAGYDPGTEQRQAETVDRITKIESALADLSEDVALVISATKEKETMPEPTKPKTDNKVEETAVDIAEHNAFKLEAYTARLQQYDVADPAAFAATLMPLTKAQADGVIAGLKPKMPDPDLPNPVPTHNAADVDVDPDATDRDKLAERVAEFAAKDNVDMSDPTAVAKLMKKLESIPETKDIYQFATDQIPADGGTPADMEAPLVG